MSMKKKHRRALDNILEVLTEDLDLQPVVTHLRSKELFSEEHENKINAQGVKAKMVLEFVSILKRSGDQAYITFRTFLLMCNGQKHIATELDQRLEEIEKTCASEETDSRKEENFDPWSFYHEQFYCFPCSHDSIGDYTNIPSTLRFLLIGKTGSGKSATGNTILGRDVFRESSRTKSETKTIRWEETKEDGGVIVRVIDTPGLFDTAGDFSNDRLSFEIAKAVFSFKDGIHLFLLVYNPSMKFTHEEEETIRHIEAVMKKEIYNFCVLILTHAKGKFGEDGKESLQRYLEEEKKENTKFSDLIKSVGDRIIAVENSFSEALLKRNHRQRLLSSLAEVVKRNHLRVYRNRLFEKAVIEINKEHTERQNRYEKKQNLFQMKIIVEKYVQQVLPNLDEKQLQNLKEYLKENIQDIMERSGANSLNYIEEKDVKTCLKEFVKCNEDIIKGYIALKELQATKARNELEKQRLIDIQENSIQMKHFVVNVVGNFLRQSEKETLKEIQESLTLPDDLWHKIFQFLTTEKVEVEEQAVKKYVQTTFFQTPANIQKYIDEKDSEDLFNKIEITVKEMAQIEKEKEQHKLAKELLNKIPDFIKELSQDNETKLRNALEGENDKEITSMVTMFLEKHLDEIKLELHMNMEAIMKLYVVENRTLILGTMKVIREETSKLNQVGISVKQHQQKLTDLQSVSDVIDEHLESYLAGKTVKELKAMNKQLNDDKIPRDILNKIMKHLFETEKQKTDETMLQEEVLAQLQNKSKIMEDLVKESKSCFPGLSWVTTKFGRKKLISTLMIGDEVLVFDNEGKLHYEKVYLMTHANKEEISIYIRISTKLGGILLISPSHLLPIGRLYNNVPAKKAVVGETIFTVKDGVIVLDTIESVSYQKSKGAFCPMTMNGTILVNDVAASCYTTFFNPSLAQTLLWPFRIMFCYLPTSVFHAIVPYDPVEGMPIILSMCRLVILTLRSTKETVKRTILG